MAALDTREIFQQSHERSEILALQEGAALVAVDVSVGEVAAQVFAEAAVALDFAVEVDHPAQMLQDDGRALGPRDVG